MIKKTKSPARNVVKKTIRKINEAENLRDLIIDGMQEKKAKEIVSIDLRSLKNSVADFFVVCHADSKTHTDAIAHGGSSAPSRIPEMSAAHRCGPAHRFVDPSDRAPVITRASDGRS